MTVYYSKGGTSGSELDFHTPSNWNTATDGTGTDATSLSGHDLILQANHYYEVTADATIGSLATEVDSHLTGASGFTIYANGKDSSNYTYNLDGTLDNDNQLNLSVTYAGTTNLDVEPQTANYLRNLTLSHASLVATLQRNLIVKDKINIINGELNCGSVNIASELANLEIHKTNSAAKLDYGTNTVTCGRLGQSNGGVGKIEGTGAAIAGTGGKIIVQKTDNLRIIDLGATAVFTGTVVIEYNGNQSSGAASQDLRASSGTYDLIVNCDNTTDTCLANASPNGINDILITKGIFDPNSSALTVAGTIEVGPDSGAADQAKFNAGASDCTIGSGKTDGVALHVRQGGTADLGSGTHTIGSIAVDNNAAAKFTNTSDTTTLDGNSNDNSRIINIGGSSTCTAAGTMNVTAAAGRLQISNQAGVNNLTLTGNVTYNLHGNSLISNTLTITSGTTLDTQTTSSSGTFRNLTVAGHIFGDGGTLTADESTITVAGQITVGTVNLTSGAITSNDDFRPTTKTNIDGNGSITATGGSQMGGLIDIGASNTPTLQAGRLHSTLDIPSGNQGQSTFNLALNEDSSGGPARHVFFHNLTLDSEGTEANTYTMKGAITCTGDLTLTDGEINTESGVNHALTVTGNVTIAAAGGLICNSSTVSVNSITISANGTLSAPDASGSLTLNGTLSAWSFQNNSTNFSHNSGTITQTAAGHIKSVSSNPMYNFILNSSSSDSHEAVFRPSSGTDCVIAANDVTVTRGIVKLNTVSNTASMAALTIGSTGTFQASSGITTLTGTFHNNGTDPTTSFVHNDGTIKLASTGNVQLRGGSSPTGTIFFNLLHDSGGYVDGYEYYKVINKLTVDSSRTWYINGSSHVKLGDTTRDIDGELEINGVLHLSSSNTGTGTSNSISGDNTNAGGAALVDINNGASSFANGAAKATEFKNLNFDGAFTTPGNSFIVKCMGDMEFDAVTVSSGDTLDVNGQRAEFGSDVTYSGTWDADGLAVFHAGFTKYGTLTNAASGDIMTMSSSGNPTFSYITGYRTFFTNGGVQLGTGGFTNVSGATIGSGNLKTGTRNTSATNLTIATDGTFEAEDNTHTVSGNLNMGGGLIGKSAVKFDDTDSNTTGFINCGSDSGIDDKFDGGGTIEAWIKPTSKGQHNSSGGIIASKIYWYFATRTDSGSNTCKLTFKQFFSGDDSEWTSTDHVIDYDKWSHVAVTYNSSAVGNNVTMYINGKQVAVTRDQAATGTRNTDAGSDFFIGNYDSDDTVHFDGTIAMIRYFDDIRTVSEIRADMFNEHANMVNTGDLIAMWQFDEGTGTTIANKGSVGAAADGTLTEGSVSGGWVGAGTFTRETSGGDGSTVKLTGDGSASFAGTSTEFHNLEVASSGKTTTFVAVGGDDKRPVIRGTLTHGGGTLTTSTNCSINIGAGGTVSSGADTSGLYFTRWYSTTAVPALTSKYLSLQANVDLAGDQINTQYIQFYNNHNMFDFNITTNRIISYANSNVIMGAGTIEFTSTTGWGTNVYDNRVFTAGPGATIKGVGAKSGFASGPNWEVVGDVINLDVTNEELVVAGTVTNCTGDIIQWHHSHDYDQKLDADTADDRDIKLGGPALDNANALNT